MKFKQKILAAFLMGLTATSALAHEGFGGERFKRHQFSPIPGHGYYGGGFRGGYRGGYRGGNREKTQA